MDKVSIIKQTHKLCEDNGVTLIYLSVFGSHLYGLDTPDSDYDFKGIYLPSKEQCYTQNIKKSITYSSGKDNSKNSKDDIDIQLWSLQYFLENVGKGETNSLDLLYSHTYQDMILYKDYAMGFLFKDHDKLYDIKNCRAFMGYAVSQAKKYGIKGTRLGVLKNVFNVIDIELKKLNLDSNTQDEIENMRLSKFFDLIIKKCYDKSYCFLKKVGKTDSIIICGKVHNGTIRISEFYERIEKEYKKYGHRAELALQNKGIDWKALSHAIRSLEQMKMLIDTGKISYPLTGQIKSKIKDIKLGLVDFKEVSNNILNKIEYVNTKLDNLKNLKQDNLANDIVRRFYL